MKKLNKIKKELFRNKKVREYYEQYKIEDMTEAGESILLGLCEALAYSHDEYDGCTVREINVTT